MRDIYEMRENEFRKGRVPTKLIIPEFLIMDMKVEFSPMCTKPYVYSEDDKYIEN